MAESSDNATSPFFSLDFVRNTQTGELGWLKQLGQGDYWRVTVYNPTGNTRATWYEADIVHTERLPLFALIEQAAYGVKQARAARSVTSSPPPKPTPGPIDNPAQAAPEHLVAARDPDPAHADQEMPDPHAPATDRTPIPPAAPQPAQPAHTLTDRTLFRSSRMFESKDRIADGTIVTVSIEDQTRLARVARHSHADNLTKYQLTGTSFTTWFGEAQITIPDRLSPAQAVIAQMIRRNDYDTITAYRVLARLADEHVATDLAGIATQNVQPRYTHDFYAALRATPGADAALLALLDKAGTHAVIERLLLAAAHVVEGDAVQALSERAARMLIADLPPSTRRIAAASLAQTGYTPTSTAQALTIALLRADPDNFRDVLAKDWHVAEVLLRQQRPDDVPTAFFAVLPEQGEQALPLLTHWLAQPMGYAPHIHILDAIDAITMPSVPEPDADAFDDDDDLPFSTFDDDADTDEQPRSQTTRIITFEPGWAQDARDAERQIDALHDDGWELVSVTGDSTVTMIFRRDDGGESDDGSRIVAEAEAVITTPDNDTETLPVAPTLTIPDANPFSENRVPVLADEVDYEGVDLLGAVRQHGAAEVASILDQHALAPVQQAWADIRAGGA